jgi:hypothetical protein
MLPLVSDRFTQPPHLAAAPIYALMVFGLLAPMASNTVIPEVPDHDHVNPVGIIVQARQAMEEDQLPLRVAPWEHAGFRYPLFQFYSPLVYTVTLYCSLRAFDASWRSVWLPLAAIACGVGAGLTAGDVAPRVAVATADYLHVRSMFLNLAESRLLTPLSTLLSPISLPFEPTGAAGGRSWGRCSRAWAGRC